MNKIATLIAVVFTLAAGCKKVEDNPGAKSASIDVECTVNGADWKLSKTDSFNIDGMVDNKGASVVASLSGKNLSLNLNRWDNTDSAAIVVTAVLSDSMLGTYDFNFSTDPANKHYIRYIKLDRSMGPPPDLVNSVGKLVITAYNPATKVLSGEFQAEITNRNDRGRMINISVTKGKFKDITFR